MLLSQSKTVAAIAAGHGLATARGMGDAVVKMYAAAEGPFTMLLTHPDPAHLPVTSTALTHLGSASARDAMQAALAGDDKLTGSTKMARMGLANSKQGVASYWPEIFVGDVPADVGGIPDIRRSGAVIWQKPFLRGEANMSHSIADLEHHHFKYDIFRQPGDVHVNFFGTATLSVADGKQTDANDQFEIEVPDFGLPLINSLAFAPVKADATTVNAL